MSGALSLETFRGLGLFAVEDFIPEPERRGLAGLIAASKRQPARVHVADAYGVDRRVRRAQIARLPAAVVAEVRRRIGAITPRLERHFGIRLGRAEDPEFVSYRRGDFFRPHRDSRSGAASSALRARRVSIVVFLEERTPRPSRKGYTGGDLVFYGLVNEAPWTLCGMPFKGRAGTLIAFRSDLAHGVTPVLSGRRSTIVTWLHGRRSSAR